jgi:large exoprotein involved in heme utilization and adhesion
MSVVGGDIEIVGGSLTSPQSHSLGVPGGRINIASVASPGEVDLNLSSQGQLLDIDTFERLGKIRIAQGAALDTSGNGGGTTVIRGGQLLVDNGSITSSNTGNMDSPGLGIDVRLRGDVRLTGEATIASSSTLQGRGGNVSVAASNITIEGGAALGSLSSGLGPGGDITVTAPTGTISLNTGDIGAGSLPSSSGSIGEVRVEAGKLIITNGAIIGSLGQGSGKSGNVIVSARESVAISGRSSQEPSGIVSFTVGEPGAISLSAPIVTIDGGIVGAGAVFPGQRTGDTTVKADQQLTLVNGAQINSSTSTDSKGGSIVVRAPRIMVSDGAQIGSGTFGLGQGGTVQVTADDTLTLTGTSPNGNVGGIDASTAGAGAAGNIVVTAPRIMVSDGAAISGSSFGPGTGGSVMVTATDTLTLTGTAPGGAFPSGILASTAGAGAAGSIVVQAGRLTLTGGGQISSNTFGSGDGGRVVVSTPFLTMDDGFILARAERGSSGNAGSIEVRGQQFILTGGAQIDSGTGSGSMGRGGDITVEATEAITIAGRNQRGNTSGLFSNTFGSGDAGRLVVSALTLTMDGGLIQAIGEIGNASDIEVRVGRLTLTNGAQIDSRTDSVGRGGQLSVMASEAITIAGEDRAGFPSGLFSNTFGSGDAGRLVVSTPLLTMDDGRIVANTVGSGHAGSLEVQVGRLTLTGGAQIDTGTRGVGRGGELRVVATEAISITGRNSQGTVSGLFSNARSQGDAGRLSISTPLLTMDDGRIAANTLGGGNAGNMDVNVEKLMLSGGAQISTGTGTDNDGVPSGIDGSGQGGHLTVVATEAITIVGRESDRFPTALATGAQFGQGRAGDLSIVTPTLTMDGGLIATSTIRPSRGDAGNLLLEVGRLTLTGGGQISTITRGSGRGGTLTVKATDAITIAGRDNQDNLSGLFSNAFSQGDAGRLSISTPLLSMDGGLIQTQTEGSGHAGSLEVQGERLALTGGAEISTSTKDSGHGGTLTVTATDSIALSRSGLRSDTSGRGEGGNLQVAAPHILLRNGGGMVAGSLGSGNAGMIRIQAGETFDSQTGSVITLSVQKGGGAIALRAGRLVHLRDSALTSSVLGGGGNAGNVTIDAPFIVAGGSQIVANAFEGQGGNIRIQAQTFLRDPASLVDASSELGINGQVNIQAPVTSLSGAVAPLQQAFAPTTELLRSRCVERLREGAVSRFVLGGRDGVPLEPGSLLLSPLEWVDQEAGVQEGQRQPQNPEPQHEWVSSAQAHAREGWEGECARWMGQPGTPGSPKRRR